MNTITLVVLIVLISVYSALTYFQNQKVKRKVVKILAGEIENPQLSKLINRAKISSKKKFTVYMCVLPALLIITVVMVVFTVNTLFYNNELDIAKSMFVSFFVIVSLSVTTIIKANAIWRLANN